MTAIDVLALLLKVGVGLMIAGVVLWLISIFWPPPKNRPLTERPKLWERLWNVISKAHRLLTDSNASRAARIGALGTVLFFSGLLLLIVGVVGPVIGALTSGGTGGSSASPTPPPTATPS